MMSFVKYSILLNNTVFIGNLCALRMIENCVLRSGTYKIIETKKNYRRVKITEKPLSFILCNCVK